MTGDPSGSGVDERLASLEERVRAAEDHLEILNLLNRYGPLVDSGAGHDAAALWQAGGGYAFTTAEGAQARLSAPEQLEDLYGSAVHSALIDTGSAHVTATPVVRVEGDHATALAYSFVLRGEDDRWIVWRAAVNHWSLVRADGRWRISERTNRAVDGSDESYALMRRVLEPRAP